jgi:nitrogen regulatory protein P-II 1
MKKIEAIVKPFKLEEVKDNLREIGIEELTVSEVKSFGRHTGHSEIHRGIEHVVDFLPQFKIEIVAAEAQAGGIVAAISKSAGKTGDVRVFVCPVDEAGAFATRSAETMLSN